MFVALCVHCTIFSPYCLQRLIFYDCYFWVFVLKYLSFGGHVFSLIIILIYFLLTCHPALWINSISVFTAIFGIYIAHMWAIYIMTLKQLIFVIQWHWFCVLYVCATVRASVYAGKHTKSEVITRCLPILLSTFPFVLRYRLSLQPEFLSARLVEQ